MGMKVLFNYWKLLPCSEVVIVVFLSSCVVAPFLLFSMWLGIGIRAAVLFCASDGTKIVAHNMTNNGLSSECIVLFFYVQFV